MYKNQEGYRDPTAGKAIQDASRIPHHVKEAHKALKDIASLLGFEVLVLRDREGIPMETVKEENEKKKEYLKQYGKALRQEKRIEEELERLKLDRMLPGALAADGLPKSSNLSDLSDYAAEVDEQERKLVEQRKKRVRIRTKIRERIEQMEDETEKDILTYHYIDLMRWKEICARTGYCWQYVHKKHSDALKKFKYAIECDTQPVI